MAQLYNTAQRLDKTKGGGFVLPCNKGHFEWLSEVVEAVAIPRAPVAAVVLNYGLAPDHAYPTQLQQATDLLRHLVTDLGKRPQDVSERDHRSRVKLELSRPDHHWG